MGEKPNHYLSQMNTLIQLIRSRFFFFQYIRQMSIKLIRFGTIQVIEVCDQAINTLLLRT